MSAARRGDWAVVDTKTYVVVDDLPDSVRAELRGRSSTSGLAYTTVWRVGRVTSVTKGEGLIMAVQIDSRGFPNSIVQRKRRDFGTAYLLPAGHDFSDLMEREFYTLDQVKAAVGGRR